MNTKNNKSLTLKLLFTLFLFFCSSALLYPQRNNFYLNIDRLSLFISSDYFSTLKNELNDLSCVDTIYVRALKLTNYNYSEALLLLTFTLIPYNVIPISTPLIKIKINIPIPTSSPEIFAKKNKNMPKELFFDTPKTDFGDKDKLAHFFGNAFLSYNLRLFDITEFIGYFVEEFEAAFFSNAKVDYRDIRANNLGNKFGKSLRREKSILPSQIFLTYTIMNFRYTL